MGWENCSVSNCRSIEVMTYYGFPVCKMHWELDCDGEINLLGILLKKERMEMATQKISQPDAVSLLESVGFADAGSYSPSRLQKKLGKLKDVVDDDTKIDHPKFQEVMEAVKAGDDFEVEANGHTEDGTKAKTEKAEKAEKPKKESNLPKKDPLKGRPFCAGVVIKRHGTEKEIDDAMAAEVDELTGKPNKSESLAWLKLALAVVKGYNSVT